MKTKAHLIRDTFSVSRFVSTSCLFIVRRSVKTACEREDLGGMCQRCHWPKTGGVCAKGSRHDEGNMGSGNGNRKVRNRLVAGRSLQQGRLR